MEEKTPSRSSWENDVNREAVYEQLKIDEGVVYGIYNDHLGYPTFGVGHLIVEDDEEYGRPVGTAVTEERVRACFARDLDIAEGECYTLYGEGTFRELPDEVQQILVNMMFNMGRPRLSKFKGMKAGVDARDWNKAADEMVDSRWYRQVTNRAERLVERMRNV